MRREIVAAGTIIAIAILINGSLDRLHSDNWIETCVSKAMQDDIYDKQGEGKIRRLRTMKFIERGGY